MTISDQLTRVDIPQGKSQTEPKAEVDWWRRSQKASPRRRALGGEGYDWLMWSHVGYQPGHQVH